MKKLTTSVLAVVLTSSFVLVDAQKKKQDTVKTQNIEGVVVTALGVKRQAKSLSTSATIVSGEKLREVSNANPFESLSGKVAGVDITVPAQPGASTKIISRGIHSLVDNQPLLIIDGTPMNSNSHSKTGFDSTFDSGTSLNDIDPSTIESMNFLKSAAATAIYGKDGANGVLIITTKRAKGRLKVDLASSIEFNEVARVPHWQYAFGQGWNGKGYDQVSGEGSFAASNQNGSWGPLFNGAIRPWGRIYNNTQQIKPYVALPDNLKEFFDIGTVFSNAVTLSGGGDYADGSLTFSDVSSNGIFPGTNDTFGRRNFGFNGGVGSDKFKVRVSANYSHKNQMAVPTGQGDDASFGKSVWQEILQNPSDVSIVDLEDQSNIFNTPSYFYTPYASNPYVVLNDNHVKIGKDRIFGNINFSYQFSKALTANWQLGADIENETRKRWGAIVNYVIGSPQDLAGANKVVGGVSEAKFTDRLYDTYFNLNYDKEINDNWKVNASGGVGYTEKNGNGLSTLVTNLILPDYYEISNSATTPIVGQNDYESRYYYVYGQGTLGYKNRYFLNASARNDWSSTLPLANNSFFYPSVGLSAVLLDGKNFLKVRGSWGQAGKDIGAYNVFSTAISGTNNAYFGSIIYPFGGNVSYEIGSQIENQKLKNELTTETEVGAEARLFNNRFNFDVALYNRDTKDMLLILPVAPSTGYTAMAGNFASVRNKGIEFSLDSYPIKSENFKWNLTYTFTKNIGKVLDVANGSEITITSAYGVFYKFVKGDEIGTFYAKMPKTNAAGQYIVNPDTGFYEVSDTPQKIGSSQRDFIMGFGNKFSYKNLSLSFNVDWKQGGKMYSYTKRLSHFAGNGIETNYNNRNPFIIPNSVIDNGDGTYSENTTPITFENITDYYNTGNNPGIENTHVIDKTFVRLRDLSFTYDLSRQWVKSLGLTGMSFTLYGKNLFLWTPKDNPYVDPEATTYGNDVVSEFGEFSANPTQRAYGFIFKLTF